MAQFAVVIAEDGRLVLCKYDFKTAPKVGDVVDIHYRVIDVLIAGDTTVIALKEI